MAVDPPNPTEVHLKEVAAAHQLRRVIEGQNAQSHNQNGMKNACHGRANHGPKKKAKLYILYQKGKTSAKKKLKGQMLIQKIESLQYGHSSNSQIKFFFGGLVLKVMIACMMLGSMAPTPHV